MGMFKKYDFWSINEKIDEIIDYYFNGNQKESQYWDHYSELINEMSCIASDMCSELQDIKTEMGFKLPFKDTNFCDEDECTQSAIAWFNTAACMLSDIDMTAIIDNEEIYGSDETQEKEKRIKALDRLTKKQQMYLYTKVIGFIMRYFELVQAFENVTSLIAELDYHQSFVINDNGDIGTPDAAYL